MAGTVEREPMSSESRVHRENEHEMAKAKNPLKPQACPQRHPSSSKAASPNPPETTTNWRPHDLNVQDFFGSSYSNHDAT